MKTNTIRTAEVKLQSMEGRLEIYKNMLTEEKREKEKAASDFMKDHHEKYIFRYEAMVETLQAAIQDMKDVLGA